VQLQCHIKLKDRSTGTNLLDETLLKDLMKKIKKRRKERFYCFGYSKDD
jgi:hypothetical protein